jgi:hypothetical protein
MHSALRCVAPTGSEINEIKQIGDVLDWKVSHSSKEQTNKQTNSERGAVLEGVRDRYCCRCGLVAYHCVAACRAFLGLLLRPRPCTVSHVMVSPPWHGKSPVMVSGRLWARSACSACSPSYRLPSKAEAGMMLLQPAPLAEDEDAGGGLRALGIPRVARPLVVRVRPRRFE